MRLVEVEDQLGSFSVDDLVASARDQESRLALVRSQVQDIRARARENLVAHKVAEAEGREGNVEEQDRGGDFKNSHCTSSL